MTTRRQRESMQVLQAVTQFMKDNPSIFHRITDVCQKTGLAVPKVNNALRRLYNMGAVVSEMRRKKINGKPYPVYLYYDFQIPTGMPHWLSPPVPVFGKDQVKHMRTVLGFTGNLGLKDAINKSKQQREGQE